MVLISFLSYLLENLVDRYTNVSNSNISIHFNVLLRSYLILVYYILAYMQTVNTDKVNGNDHCNKKQKKKKYMDCNI